MKIVVAGGGRVGMHVATHLLESGHGVTLIDRDERVARTALDARGLVALAGDATDPHVLAEADVARAELVVALLPRDADNLAVAWLVKSGSAARVCARVKDHAYRPLYQAAGVERVLSETDVLIGALATAIAHPAVRSSMRLGDGDTLAFEVAIAKGAAADGATVHALAATPGFPASCVVAGLVSPRGEVRAPRGATRLGAGDVALLVAPGRDLDAVIGLLCGPPAPAKRSPSASADREEKR